MKKRGRWSGAETRAAFRPVGQQTEIPPVSAGTGVSSVAAAALGPGRGTQERPDDKSKALEPS
ncbi:MAG: hypothetical protein ACLR7Z_02340 [Bilophila wadsworthia]